MTSEHPKIANAKMTSRVLRLAMKNGVNIADAQVDEAFVWGFRIIEHTTGKHYLVDMVTKTVIELAEGDKAFVDARMKFLAKMEGKNV